MVFQKLKPILGNERKWIDLFAPAFCIGYFLCLAGGGLQAFFTGDDAMNLAYLHDCFQTPLAEIARQALIVVSGEYRPVGGLFYRLLYAAFGFDPFPFRAAAFALLAVNLLPAYRLARTLSGSREAALTAAFLLSCNASFVELYHSTGTIYDILCFGFFAGALQLYCGARSGGGRLGGKKIAGVVILYGCALGSKEMAVAFPVVLALYELVYHPRTFRRGNFFAGLRRPHLLTIAGLGVLTAAYAAVKLTAGNPLSGNAAYRPELSFGMFAASLRHYLPRWLYLPGLGETGALLLVATAAAGAFRARAKELLFGVGFVLATLLPVAFIPPRGGFAFYLPAFGCALFLGAAAARMSAKLFARRRAGRLAVLRGVPFLLIAAALTPLHRAGLKEIPGYYYYESSRKIFSDLQRMHPDFPEGSRIYFDEDPYPTNDFTLVFLAQLAYDDPTLRVDRRKVIGSPFLPYDFFFTFREGRVEPIAPIPPDVASVENPVPMLFQPEIGTPGEEVSVQVKRFAGRTIDVYWRRYAAGGRSYDADVAPHWCAVDAGGFCSVSLPEDFPRSRIEILYVRDAGGQGKWHAAQGILQVR